MTKPTKPLRTLTLSDLARPTGGVPVRSGIKAGALTIKQKVTENAIEE